MMCLKENLTAYKLWLQYIYNLNEFIQVMEEICGNKL